MAVVFPWLTGGVEADEFLLPYSVLLGVFFAIPSAYGAVSLQDTPYRVFAIGFWCMAGLWVAHLLVSIGLTLQRVFRG